MEIGTRAPLHLGASNLILLAHLAPERQREVARHWLPDPAGHAELGAVLEEVRRSGYCYTNGQYTPGVAAIAVPVLTPDGALVAGLSVGGYAERFTREVAAGLLDSLREVAGAIARDHARPAEVAFA